MQAKGWGRIVNISSVAGKKPGGVYNVSKAAVDMLTSSLAQELTSQGVNVNAISPGLVYTDMTRGNLDQGQKMEEAAQDIPVGRVGNVMGIANMALYLVSDKADFMSGANVVIDGGSLQQG